MPRRKTGLKRPYPVQVDFTEEEDEYISRLSFDMELSKSAFIRRQIFSTKLSDWRTRLGNLRKDQKGVRGVWKKRKRG